MLSKHSGENNGSNEVYAPVVAAQLGACSQKNANPAARLNNTKVEVNNMAEKISINSLIPRALIFKVP